MGPVHSQDVLWKPTPLGVGRMSTERSISLTLNSVPQQTQTRVLDLTTPKEYVEFLHPVEAQGRVALAQRDGVHWIERTLPTTKAAVTVTDWTGQEDSYISINRFKGRRLLANLYSLRAVWADLDHHKLKRWQNWDAEGIWEIAVQEYLSDAGLPHPTLGIASGRGLYLIWIFQPVPAQALPRWSACQRRIYEAFRSLGADRQAMDAARVLRLVGTTNSKSGHAVRVLGGDGYEWDFDALADEILPLSRTEIHDLRVRRALRDKNRKPTPRRHQSLQTLWAARLSDINTLIGMRYPNGQIPSGERDGYIFMSVICMSWLTESPRTLEQEIVRFTRQHTPWNDREIRSRASAVLKRMEMVRRGDKVEWKGRQVDPRYHLKTSTIIEWLGINTQEQRNMRTLIGSEEKRRRRGFHDTRQGYIANHHQERSQPWNQLGMSRATWYAVGKPLPEPSGEYPENPDNQ